MIAEILVQMMQRRSNKHKLGDKDKEFLSKILSEENGKEGLAGTMAKAAAPKEKVEKDKKRNQKQRRRTAEERDEYLANAMMKADETMAIIRKLASNTMPIKEAKEAKAKMKSVAEILHRREKERARKKFAEWIALMITGSVGKLHDWSKEVDTTGGTAVMCDEKKKDFDTDPNVVLDERKHGWGDIWQCKDNEARARTNKAIREAIDEAKQCGTEGATLTDRRKIAATAGKFKKNTSVWLDLWAIKEIAQCNHEDLDKLAGLYREWDIEVTAPAQWLVNLMAMIPKKKGHR